nr:MAG TPA: hypothetical protein [Caudoviricetes sp.]
MASMMDLVGKSVKVGKTSITIKDDDNKTRGIVRNVVRLEDIQFNKYLDYWAVLKKLGVNEVLGTSDFFVKDGAMYAIRNTKGDRYEKYADEYERKRIAERREAYKKLEEGGVPVIECVVL